MRPFGVCVTQLTLFSTTFIWYISRLSLLSNAFITYVGLYFSISIRAYYFEWYFDSRHTWQTRQFVLQLKVLYLLQILSIIFMWKSEKRLYLCTHTQTFTVVVWLCLKCKLYCTKFSELLNSFLLHRMTFYFIIKSYTNSPKYRRILWERRVHN